MLGFLTYRLFGWILACLFSVLKVSPNGCRVAIARRGDCNIYMYEYLPYTVVDHP